MSIRKFLTGLYMAVNSVLANRQGKSVTTNPQRSFDWFHHPRRKRGKKQPGASHLIGGITYQQTTVGRRLDNRTNPENLK